MTKSEIEDLASEMVDAIKNAIIAELAHPDSTIASARFLSGQIHGVVGFATLLQNKMGDIADAKNN